MAWVDAVVRPPYFMKSFIKILLFSLLPMLCFYKEKNNSLSPLFHYNKDGLKLGFALGLGIFTLIFGGYFLIRPYFDFSNITTTLSQGLGVNGNNFLFVALYISFANSFLEEFFFRGFGFLKLKQVTSRCFAYGFSSLVFALYHVAMMIGWFSPFLFLLALLGLFAGGLIFNYVNEKYSNIYISWLIHLCANLGINGVGFVLFSL